MFTKNKKLNIILISLLSIFAIVILGYFSYKNFFEKTQKTQIDSDLLVRNNSWQSPYLENIPYKKGDELELNFILKDKGENEVNLNISKLKNKIDIDKISIDDQEIDKNKDDILLKKSKKLKIIGKARDNGIIKKEDNDIQIDNLKNIEEEKKEEETYTGEINTQISLEKYLLNSNINNLIEIFGEGKEFVKYVNIGGISLTPIKYNSQVFLSINQNTFEAGEYFIIVQFTNSEITTLNEKIKFEFSNSKVNIANITPDNIKNDIDRYIVLQGNGFKKVISIQLNNNIILKNTSFDIINDNVLSVKIPSNLEIGKYYFNIMTTDGIYEIENKPFTINN